MPLLIEDVAQIRAGALFAAVLPVEPIAQGAGYEEKHRGHDDERRRASLDAIAGERENQRLRKAAEQRAGEGKKVSTQPISVAASASSVPGTAPQGVAAGEAHDVWPQLRSWRSTRRRG